MVVRFAKILNNFQKLAAKIFDHVEKYAHSKYKMHALFWVSFLEHSVSPIMPDFLIIPISMYKKYSAFFVSMFAAVASFLGGAFTYLLAMYFGQIVIDKFSISPESVMNVKEMLSNNIFITMLVVGFTPIPDKLFTIVGGAVKISFWPLMLALFLGKFIRFYIVAYIAENYGAKARDIILNRFNKVMMYLSILIIILCVSYYLYFK